MLAKSPYGLMSDESTRPFAHALAPFSAELGPIAQDVFMGTSGDDHFVGTSGPDDFQMRNNPGGNDTLTGKGGDDAAGFGTDFGPGDHYYGGNGSDDLTLQGDYSAGLVLNSTIVSDVEQLDLYGANPGDSYSITIDDSAISNHGFMVVHFYGDTGPAENLHVDASDERGGNLALVSATNGDDVLIGGAGNDYINGNSQGTDVLDGGGGINRVGFLAGQPVTISLLMQGVPQDIGGGRMVTISHFQDVVTGLGADTVIGDGEDNWIDSIGDNATISGNGGNDLIDTTDAPYPGHNVVVADGGDGTDTLSFAHSQFFGVSVSLALQGAAQPTGQGSGTINASNFENLVGTNNFNDVLAGDNGRNAIFGSGGDDTISGGNGNDHLYGDAVYGPVFDFGNGYSFRKGFDISQTAAGDDTLTGGSGKDLIYGGGGADTFVYLRTRDSMPGANHRDVIDFSQSDHDKIDLHHIDADTTHHGNQAFHLGGSVFTNSAGEIIQFDDGSGHTVVAGDVNGDGVADFEIQLTTSVTLVASDFTL